MPDSITISHAKEVVSHLSQLTENQYSSIVAAKDDTEKEKLKYQERKLRLWSNFLLHNSKSRDCENTLSVHDIEEIYKKQNGL
jgi:predicted amidophosphoribosyltransferase